MQSKKRYAHMDSYEGMQARPSALVSRPAHDARANTDVAVQRSRGIPGLPTVVRSRRPQTQEEAILQQKEKQKMAQERRELGVFAPSARRQDEQLDRWHGVDEEPIAPRPAAGAVIRLVNDEPFATTDEAVLILETVSDVNESIPGGLEPPKPVVSRLEPDHTHSGQTFGNIPFGD
ncbi:hypothetical protein BH10PAT3_BH10PAT3_2920 [soil metagenome]